MLPRLPGEEEEEELLLLALHEHQLTLKALRALKRGASLHPAQKWAKVRTYEVVCWYLLLILGSFESGDRGYCTIINCIL